MSRNIWMVAAAALALVGCDKAGNQDAQYDDSRNPYYKRATQDLENNNPAAAANDYEAALGANPKLVEAHYQLGHIYGEKLNDPIGSIFHFQQYLKVAATPEKADEVKQLIDKQSQTFAAGLPNSPTQSADDYAKLQAENATLNKKVSDLTGDLTKLKSEYAHVVEKLQTASVPKEHEHAPAVSTVPATSVASATPAPASTEPAPAVAATPATPAAPTFPKALPLDATNAAPIISTAPGTPPAASVSTAGARSYTVVKGDSIWKIAHKMYPGDLKNGMDKINEANKDILTGKPLKIGQVLVIP